MEQIDKVKGIITFKLQYKNRNSNFDESIRNIFKNGFYDEEMYTKYIDKVGNLKAIIDDSNILFAIREQENYLIVKDLNKNSREISLYIVWQSNKEFSQVCHESIEKVNDLIRKKWEDSDRKKSMFMPFQIPDSPNITIYPAYINGKKVESDSGSVIKNVLVQKTDSFDKREFWLNVGAIVLAIAIFWKNLEVLLGLIIPMLVIVLNLLIRYFKKDYKTIINNFNILESADDAIRGVEPHTDDLTIPKIDLNLEGDENA